ncbi:MAG: SDR family oxidoreductase [Acetobacteraceae bacterium]|nr:SDR family oxidoreductase [Acetobacteraceae bacterium]
MAGRLEGKVALITGGGAGGIGGAAAVLFAREGAKVVIAELKRDTGEASEAAVRAAGGEALFVPTDVTSEDSVREAVRQGVARFGALHVLFNSAGGSIPADSLVTDVDLAAVWNHTMNLDLLGTIHACRHAIPEIIKAGGGSVVNMSSGAALRGASPSHIYTAAKGAILSLTRAMAGAYAHQRVRVNAICAGRIHSQRILSTFGTPENPGPVFDRQDPAGRVKEYPFWVGQPEDIANIALFLASEESRMITGAAIPAEGGRSAY